MDEYQMEGKLVKRSIRVTSGFRKKILKLYPGLSNKKEYWSLMNYLLFQSQKEKRTKRIKVGEEILARVEGRSKQLKSRNYHGKSLLDKFKLAVMDKDMFKIIGYQYPNNGKKGMCRTVGIIWKEDVKKLLLDEVIEVSKRKTEYVDFVSGENWTSRDSKRTSMECLQQCERNYSTAEKAVIHLLKYMNRLHSNVFSKVVNRNYRKTVTSIMELADKIKSSKMDRRLWAIQQMSVLVTISDQPKPFYKPSSKGNTTRISPANVSMLQLTSDVRHVLTNGWYEFDLKNCQLAIAAKLWNMDEVRDILDSRVSIWEFLFDQLGYDYFEMKERDCQSCRTLKGAIKEGLYSIMYGMARKNAMKRVDELCEGCFQGIGNRLLGISLMKYMLSKRNKRIAKCFHERVVYTIFGKRINVENRKQAVSAMSQEIQAIELKLLLPVVELAIDVSYQKKKPFTITLWQHDGFSIAVHDRSKSKTWINRISRTTFDEISRLGINTNLEMKNDTSITVP